MHTRLAGDREAEDIAPAFQNRFRVLGEQQLQASASVESSWCRRFPPARVTLRAAVRRRIGQLADKSPELPQAQWHA